MSLPNLFRAGNVTSPYLRNVRIGVDIIVRDGKVGPSKHSYLQESVAHAKPFGFSRQRRNLRLFQ